MGDRPLRQQAHLDLAGDPQLLLEPLLLRVLAQQILDPAGHHVERLGELAELVVGPDGNAGAEVTLAQPLRAHRQRVDVAGDGAGQQRAHEQRAAVDDEEEPADDGHALHEDVAHVQGAGREATDELGGLVADGEAHHVLLAGGPVRAVDDGEEQDPARAVELRLQLALVRGGDLDLAVRAPSSLHLLVRSDHGDAGARLEAREERLVGRHVENEERRALDPQAAEGLALFILDDAGEGGCRQPSGPGGGRRTLPGERLAVADERPFQVGVEAAGGRETVLERLPEPRVIETKIRHRGLGQVPQVLGGALHLGGDHVRGGQRQSEEADEQEEDREQDERNDGNEEIRHEHLRADPPHQTAHHPSGKPG